MRGYLREVGQIAGLFVSFEGGHSGEPKDRLAYGNVFRFIPNGNSPALAIGFGSMLYGK